MSTRLLDSETVRGFYAEDCCYVQRTKFPKEPRCRFTNVQNNYQHLFVAYADFESILQPVNEDVFVTQGVDTGVESSTHVHTPCSFAYKVVRSVYPEFSRRLVINRGEDAAKMFVRKLQLEAEQLFDE